MCLVSLGLLSAVGFLWQALKISTISFRSRDDRSHPWVRRLYSDIFSNQWGMKIDESVEDTVIL